MREGKGFLLVYNITSKSSFDEVALLRDKILRAKEMDKDIPIVIAGNKVDLRDPNDINQVTTLEAQEKANKWGAPFYETSAKEKVNNEECFYQVVREIRKADKKKNKAKKKPNRRSFCTLL